MPHKDPKARREYMRGWRQRHADQLRKERKFIDAVRHANQRALKYGVSGKLTLADVREVLTDGTCHYCGSDDALSLDHVKALHGGGPNIRSNIVACCRPCNISKWRGDRPWRWARDYDSCTKCGTTTIAHLSHGLCKPCYRRDRTEREFREAGGMSERELQTKIIQLAKLTGWHVHHSRRNQDQNGKWLTPLEGHPGFVDLVLARDGVVLLRELKGPKGRVSSEQEAWLAALGSLAKVWTALDWPEIQETLTAARTRPA